MFNLDLICTDFLRSKSMSQYNHLKLFSEFSIIKIYYFEIIKLNKSVQLTKLQSVVDKKKIFL